MTQIIQPIGWILWGIVGIWFQLTSCTLHPIETSNQTSEQPVISGYVTPNDSLIQLAVRRQAGLNQALLLTQTGIADALVQISYNGKTQTLLYNAQTHYYEGIAHFKPGDTVSLFVKLSDGHQATAETKIPLSSAPIQYQYLGDRAFELSWKSPARKTYYYAYLESIRTNNRLINSNFTLLSPNSYSFESKGNTDNMALTGLYPRDMLFSTDAYKQAKATFALCVLDSAFYQFTNSRSGQDLLLSSPFQERVPVFNNIKGGLGLFGSYIIQRVSVTINQ